MLNHRHFETSSTMAHLKLTHHQPDTGERQGQHADNTAANTVRTAASIAAPVTRDRASPQRTRSTPQKCLGRGPLCRGEHHREKEMIVMPMMRRFWPSSGT